MGFVIEPESEALPIVWECPHCERIVVLYGAAVARSGYVTCLSCLRPMHITAETVH